MEKTFCKIKEKNLKDCNPLGTYDHTLKKRIRIRRIRRKKELQRGDKESKRFGNIYRTSICNTYA